MAGLNSTACLSLMTNSMNCDFSSSTDLCMSVTERSSSSSSSLVDESSRSTILAKTASYMRSESATTSSISWYMSWRAKEASRESCMGGTAVSKDLRDSYSNMTTLLRK